ncbi:MAG: hypothetical protein ACRCYO_04080 [Bacteroidia bacterium]
MFKSKAILFLFSLLLIPLLIFCLVCFVPENWIGSHYDPYSNSYKSYESVLQLLALFIFFGGNLFLSLKRVKIEPETSLHFLLYFLGYLTLSGIVSVCFIFLWVITHLGKIGG